MWIPGCRGGSGVVPDLIAVAGGRIDSDGTLDPWRPGIVGSSLDAPGSGSYRIQLNAPFPAAIAAFVAIVNTGCAQVTYNSSSGMVTVVIRDLDPLVPGTWIAIDAPFRIVVFAAP